MVNAPSDWTWRIRVFATAIVSLAVAAPLASRAEKPEEKQAAKAETKKAKKLAKKKAEKSAAPADPEKARKLVQAILELQAALKDDAKSPAAKPPERPAKTVTPPSLKPSDLDAMILKRLDGSKVAPSPLTNDDEFIRRAYLDLTGTLPKPEEIVAFRNAKDKNKRSDLVDKLLAGDEFSKNWARYWRDVIFYRAPNPNPQQVGFPRFEEWLAEQFKKNRPWDEIATEIITAKGRNDENGATAFTLAQMTQPVEIAGEVSRIFMGVQIQCAQCHDHPTDSWKRQQFHEFAAFFAGLRARRAGQQPIVFEVAAQGRPRYTMPDLKDPQKSIPIAPKFFLASKSEKLDDGLSADDRRALAASFVAGQDNPWFAKAFVNRVWYALMGEAFYLPIDDLGENREVQAPEVLDAIASQWKNGGYDVRWLYRTILNTHAYQRQVRATNTVAGRTAFAANCSSRLRADQIFDALTRALDISADGPPAGRARSKADLAAQKAVLKAQGAPKGAMGRQLADRLNFNRTFGVDPSMPNDDVLGTIPQALVLMNDQRINGAIRGERGTMLAELLKSQSDNRVVLETLYLRVLARKPNSKEIEVCGRYLASVTNRGEAFEDILWSLINSTEFVSRR